MSIKLAPLKDAFFCDAVERRRDPTGTSDIRRRYHREVRKRFRNVRIILQEAIVTQDILGLKPTTMSAIALAGGPGNKQVMFQTWFDATLKRIVIENDGMWLRGMVAAAYNRAVSRAMRLTGVEIKPKDMEDSIANLVALCVIELQGVCEAVSQNVMRAASLALIHHGTAPVAYRAMAKSLKSIGINRASIMVDLMTVKAFTTGTLDQFVVAKITQVGLVPEMMPIRRIADAPRITPRRGPGARSRERAPSGRTVRRIRGVGRALEEVSEFVNVQTAGDDFVCPICEGIEDDNPYTIDEARSLIPAHPRCRCAFVPLEETERGRLFEGDAYNPNQPRDPKGAMTGGQWTGGEIQHQQAMEELRKTQEPVNVNLPNGGKLNYHYATTRSNTRGRSKGAHQRVEIVYVQPGAEYGKVLRYEAVQNLLRELYDSMQEE